MVDRLPAPRLEFCGASAGLLARALMGPPEVSPRDARPTDTRARLPADRNAKEQRHRIRDRVLRGRLRLCHDLAHLVDGRSWTVRPPADPAWLCLPSTGRSRDRCRASGALRAGPSDGDRGMNVAIAIDEV